MSTPTSAIRRDLFTIRECARSWGVAENTVYTMTYTEELESVRIGRAVRIPREAIERLGYPIPEVDAREAA